MKPREVSDMDIWRNANELVKQRGNDAVIHAAMRVDKEGEKRMKILRKLWWGEYPLVWAFWGFFIGDGT